MILNIGIKVIIMKEYFKWILYENSDSELFDLYSMNSNVSLVILYDDNGSIDDNEKYIIKLRTCDTLENR
jgi:hypothetical protein